MSGRRKNVAIESFLVVILMIVFSISIAVLIVQGSSTFQKTLEHREKEENLRIAMSYINMTIRQNDSKNVISFPEPPSGFDMMLKLSHTGEEKGMNTYIYFKDGTLYECYTEGEIDTRLSTAIVPLKGMTLNYDAKNGVATFHYPHTIENEQTTLEQIISLRSKEVMP